MKAIIAPDAARTPGVAVICVYDAPGAGPADVAIYSGDGKYLSIAAASILAKKAASPCPWTPMMMTAAASACR